MPALGRDARAFVAQHFGPPQRTNWHCHTFSFCGYSRSMPAACSGARVLRRTMMAEKRRPDRHQEIRQPAALQYRHQHLCDARRPGRDGQEGRGLHRPGRQDRRGHHPFGADADHLRAGDTRPADTLLPISFLRQLIRFYGDQMQMLVPSYLEHSMQAFTENRSRCASRSTRPSARRRSARTCRRRSTGRGAGAAQHGDVPAGDADVFTLHQLAAAEGDQEGRSQGYRRVEGADSRAADQARQSGLYLPPFHAFRRSPSGKRKGPVKPALF